VQEQIDLDLENRNFVSDLRLAAKVLRDRAG
jgi:hypothetical protein